MELVNVRNPTHIARHECLICYSEFRASQVTVCFNQHVICLNCQKAISRLDCLICSPQEISITITEDNEATSQVAPRRTESTESTESTERRERRYRRENSPCLTEEVHCLLGFLKYVSIFWLTVYLGKVYFALFYYCNPQFDDSWLGWATFRHILADILCGVVVSTILFSCCCLSN